MNSYLTSNKPENPFQNYDFAKKTLKTKNFRKMLQNDLFGTKPDAGQICFGKFLSIKSLYSRNNVDVLIIVTEISLYRPPIL